jgi:hypothetical protein
VVAPTAATVAKIASAFLMRTSSRRQRADGETNPAYGAYGPYGYYGPGYGYYGGPRYYGPGYFGYYGRP